jgi:hypothetical protein
MLSSAYASSNHVSFRAPTDLSQLDSIDREGIEAPASIINKNDEYQCKKHASVGKWLHVFPCYSSRYSNTSKGCTQCYGWKKQINRLRVQAKKKGGKK